jgi:hypothetical protein
MSKRSPSPLKNCHEVPMSNGYCFDRVQSFKSRMFAIDYSLIGRQGRPFSASCCCHQGNHVLDRKYSHLSLIHLALLQNQHSRCFALQFAQSLFEYQHSTDSAPCSFIANCTVASSLLLIALLLHNELRYGGYSELRSWRSTGCSSCEACPKERPRCPEHN